MTCEHYWRDGILLVEQGRPDPHRDTCLDCRRAHEARSELVRAFALVGAKGGDARWQARVWRTIERAEAPRRAWLPWAGALAAACAVGAVSMLLLGRPGGGERPGEVEGLTAARGRAPAAIASSEGLPRFEIVPSKIARRSTSAGIGDLVRIRVAATDEARIYHAERLILRCTAATPALGCARDAGGLIAEHVLELPGEYQLVIAPAGTAEPTAGAGDARTLDADLAAIMDRRRLYQLRTIAVR